MKDLKFKFYDKKNKEILHPVNGIVKTKDGKKIMACASIMNSERTQLVPLEFTGLKDMDGNDIYANDILRNDLEYVSDYIVWNNEWQYHLKTNVLADQDEITNGEWRIVGNMMTEPELLEETN